MQRSKAIALLREHLDDLRRFSVKSIALFGSVARDEARDDSDVDVLVDFTEVPKWSTFLDLQEYLEALFGRHVDLVARGAVPVRKRALLEAEAIVVS